MFALSHPERSLRATGTTRIVRASGARAVEERVRDFFATGPVDGPRILVGALPFDAEREVLLIQPGEAVFHDGPREGSSPLAPHRRATRGAPTIVEEPPAAAYEAMVRKALDRIAASNDGLRKVVLARSLRIEMDAAPDAEAIAARLSGDPDVTVFLADLPAAPGGARRSLVGATPELLLSRRGLAVRSHPLAGSAARQADPAADRAAAAALLRSDKDRREHALAAEAVLDLLAPFCAELRAPEGMALCSTTTMWHLGTRIEGVLKSADAPSAAGLAALLHPTPAVGGDPREAALATIRALETEDRGYYAGAVGWVDAAGDGEWHVALRCAQIAGNELILHAGAGIVAGSDPAQEVAETSAKFRAMLLALGLDDQGQLLESAA